MQYIKKDLISNKRVVIVSIDRFRHAIYGRGKGFLQT